jgi:hypothetical protein
MLQVGQLVIMQCSAVQGSEELADELIRELLRFSRCEPLLLEAGS